MHGEAGIETLPTVRAASIFKVSVSTAIRRANRMADTGSCAAKRSGGDGRSKDVETRADWLLALNRAEPDLTLAEIQTRLKEAHGALGFRSDRLRNGLVVDSNLTA